MSEKIAEARIHVERAMQRIKMYHILDNEFNLSMAHLADQIFTVCAFLVNFQSSFLKYAELSLQGVCHLYFTSDVTTCVFFLHNW